MALPRSHCKEGMVKPGFKVRYFGSKMLLPTKRCRSLPGSVLITVTVIYECPCYVAGTNLSTSQALAHVKFGTTYISHHSLGLRCSNGSSK